MRRNTSDTDDRTAPPPTEWATSLDSEAPVSPADLDAALARLLLSMGDDLKPVAAPARTPEGAGVSR